MKEKKLENGYKKSIYISIIIASLIIIPFIIKGHGIINVSDDFNLQQIPFGVDANRMIKEGNIFWDWNVDIGSSFIGAYSFYSVGSPFYILTLLFPSSFFPYLVGPLMIIKYVVASVAAFAFMKRFIKDEKYAIIGGILYAFSGFQIANMIFHFHDIVALFPLLLISFEELILNNRKGFFAIMVTVSLLTNYVFFLGEFIFLAIYGLSRLVDEKFRKKINVKKVIEVFFEGCIGVGISCVLILPSVLFTLDNPRLENSLTLKNAFIYNKRDFLDIIRAFLMPAEIPHSRGMIYGLRFTSTELFMPLFGSVLLFTFLTNKQTRWIKVVLAISGLFMFVPILNSSFSAFNSGYYSRWFYMPILIMALATVKVLDNKDTKYTRGIILTGAIWIAFISMVFILNRKDGQVIFDNQTFKFNLIITIVSMIATIMIIQIRNKKMFFNTTMVLVIIFSAVMGQFYIYKSQQAYPESKEFNKLYTTSADYMELPSGDDYRIDNLACYRNSSVLWNKMSIQSFITTVNGSAFEFYNSIGMHRDSETLYNYDKYGLRPLLSVKYVFKLKDYPNVAKLINYGDITLPNLKKVGEQGQYEIYESEDFIPIGFTYDSYASKTKFYEVDINNRHLALLKAIVLDDDQIEKYRDCFSEISSSELNDTSIEKYNVDVKNRREGSAYHFERDNKGFTSKIKLQKENLVFFSVPYDKGWRATVNGKKVDVENVNNGLMAVKAEAGDNVIRFEYTPEGLKVGGLITSCSLIILVIYMIFGKKKVKNNS